MADSINKWIKSGDSEEKALPVMGQLTGQPLQKTSSLMADETPISSFNTGLQQLGFAAPGQQLSGMEVDGMLDGAGNFQQKNRQQAEVPIFSQWEPGSGDGVGSIPGHTGYASDEARSRFGEYLSSPAGVMDFVTNPFNMFMGATYSSLGLEAPPIGGSWWSTPLYDAASDYFGFRDSDVSRDALEDVLGEIAGRSAYADIMDRYGTRGDTTPEQFGSFYGAGSSLMDRYLSSQGTVGAKKLKEMFNQAQAYNELASLINPLGGFYGGYDDSGGGNGFDSGGSDSGDRTSSPGGMGGV